MVAKEHDENQLSDDAKTAGSRGTPIPVLPLGDDRLVEKDFDPRRADRGALDRVSHIILGRRVRSQTASLSFTWGVLDRLLEEKRIDIEGISATSAGAMNAAVLAYGFATGGRDGARAALAAFWRRVSRAARTSPQQASWLDRAFGNHSLRFSPAFVLFDLATRKAPAGAGGRSAWSRRTTRSCPRPARWSGPDGSLAS